MKENFNRKADGGPKVIDDIEIQEKTTDWNQAQK